MAKEKSIAAKKEKQNLHDDGFDAYKAAAMSKLASDGAEDEYDAYHFKDGLEPNDPMVLEDSQEIEKKEHNSWASDDAFIDDWDEWSHYDIINKEQQQKTIQEDPVEKLLQGAIKLKADADLFSMTDHYLSDFELKKLQDVAYQMKQEADALLSNIELAKSVKGIMTPTTNLLKQKSYKTLAKGASTGFLNAAIQSQAISLNMQHMMEMNQKDLETQMAAQNLVEMKAYQKEMQLKMMQKQQAEHMKNAQLEDMKAELHTLVYGGLVFDPLTNMSKPDINGNVYSLKALKEATEKYKKQHGLAPSLNGSLDALKAAQPVFDEAAKHTTAKDAEDTLSLYFKIKTAKDAVDKINDEEYKYLNQVASLSKDHTHKGHMKCHVPGAIIAEIKLGGHLFTVYRFAPYTKDGFAYPTVDAMSDWDARVVLDLSVSQYADLVQAGALTVKGTIVYENEVEVELQNLVLVQGVQHLLRMKEEMQLADDKAKKHPSSLPFAGVHWGPAVGWKNQPNTKKKG